MADLPSDIEAHYITLSRTPARERGFQLQGNWPFPVERCEGVDAKTLPPPHTNKGLVGCFLSHKNLWLAQEKEWMVIIEDDCRFDDDVVERFVDCHEQAVELDADLWYPGGHYVHKLYEEGKIVSTDYQVPRKVHRTMVHTKGVDRTHCYVVRKRLAKKMASMDLEKYPVESPDWWMRKWIHSRYRVLAADPWMCGQDQKLESTITGATRKGITRWDLIDLFRVPIVVVDRWEDWMFYQPHIKGIPKKRSLLAKQQQAALDKRTFMILFEVPDPEKYSTMVFTESDWLVSSEKPHLNLLAWEYVTQLQATEAARKAVGLAGE